MPAVPSFAMSGQQYDTGAGSALSGLEAGGAGALAALNPYAALAGIGLEFAGNMMAQNQGVSRRTVRRRGIQAIGKARSQDALFAGLEESALRAGQKKELAGFQGARNALGLGGELAKAGVSARGRQRQADVEQSVVSKGLLGTSTGAQNFAGVGDQTSMQLAQIDTQLAQAFADLGLQEAQVGGAHGRELAGLAARRRASERALQEAEFGLMTMA